MEYFKKTVEVPAVDTKKVLVVTWNSKTDEITLDGILLLGAKLEAWKQNIGGPDRYGYPVYWSQPYVEVQLDIRLANGGHLTLKGDSIRFEEIK